MLDTCVWGGAGGDLEDAGHEVVWSGDWESDPGDEEILELALAQDRVLVTLDKDFGELAVVHGRAHHGIVRLVGFAAREQGPALVELLRRYEDDLSRSAIITASPERVRVRPAKD